MTTIVSLQVFRTTKATVALGKFVNICARQIAEIRLRKPMVFPAIYVALLAGYGVVTVLMLSKWDTSWTRTPNLRAQDRHTDWKIPSSIVVSDSMMNSDYLDSDTCGKIIDLDEFSINRTVGIEMHKFQPLKKVIAKLTNCDDYFSERSFINFSVTKEETIFSIAYSVLIYTEFAQFEDLLEAIWRPQNVVCVHVDRKSPRLFQEAVVRLVSCFDNVFVASSFISVHWGKYSVLQADLICMRDLWRQKTKWRYFINLTGQEFPLKTNFELVRILTAYNGTNDIFGWTRRADHNRWAQLPPPPHQITPMKGPVHIIASRGYVDYVLHDPVAQDFLEWARRVVIPDETFFSTLNNNMHLRVPGQFKGLVNQKDRRFLGRYKIWMFRPVEQCRGKYVHAVCVFGVRDLQQLTSSKCLFANKLHYDYQPVAFECLRRWYFRKVQRELEGYIEMNTTIYRRYAAGLNPQF